MIPAVIVSIDVSALVAAMTDLQREQAPFATSRAVNDLANMAVAGVQETMKTNFTIRRPWVLGGIFVRKYSNKKDDPLEAILAIRDDRAFLAKFEDGGVKLPRGKNLALPAEIPGVTKASVVPAGSRPRAFGQWQNRRGNERTFIILEGPGAGIWQRYGPSRGQIRQLWSYRSSARIDKLLHMGETSRGVVEEWWKERFYIRMDEALATSRLKPDGSARARPSSGFKF